MQVRDGVDQKDMYGVEMRVWGHLTNSFFFDFFFNVPTYGRRSQRSEPWIAGFLASSGQHGTMNSRTGNNR